MTFEEKQKRNEEKYGETVKKHEAVGDTRFPFLSLRCGRSS